MADGKVVFDIEGDDSKISKSLDGVEKKSHSVGSAMGTGLKVGAAALAAVGAAAVAAGSAIVSAYGEFEQVAGGAQLLFGDAYDYIAEKAENAYATVQMSQTDYLQQVNGFATGLKTALGGNAQAAAELADRIVSAEADIVAATGNTAENVQNAFNGIMKSNYTMLDNLQLGITPTKEGFQELINTVNAYNEAHGKATNYTIDNLADAQSALLDYIEMQGLAGYAAGEAADTIQGSAAATKAAWENLITGLGDADADVGKLVQNLADSFANLVGNVTPIAENIISALPTAIEAILGALAELLPPLLEAVGEIIIASLPILLDAALQLVDGLCTFITENAEEIGTAAVDLVFALCEGLIKALPDLLNAAAALVGGLVAALVEHVGEFISTAWDWAMGLVQGIGEKVSDVLTAGAELVTSLITDLLGRAGDFLSTAWEWVANLVSGIAEKTGDVVNQGLQLVSDVISNLRGKVGEFLSTAQEWISNVVTGIKNKTGDVLSSAKSLVQQLIAAIRSGISGMLQAGKDLLGGMISGIKAKVADAVAAVKNAVGNVVSGAKRALGIASPSKVFRQIGQQVDEGFAVGIEGEEDSPLDAMQSMVRRLVTSVNIPGLSDVFSAIGGAFSASRQTEVAATADLSGLLPVLTSIRDAVLDGKTLVVDGRAIAAVVASGMRDISRSSGAELIDLRGNLL